MKWEDVLVMLADQPVIDTQMLLAGGHNPAAVQVQLSRWVKAGRLLQLRRGMYLFAEPYRKTPVHPSYLASLLYRPSYISLEYALAYYGLIPEGVPKIISVTTRRPSEFFTPMGVFTYRHIKRELFWGYQPLDWNGQIAFYALPEKALLDTFYLRSHPLTKEFLKEMRLQNLETIDFLRLAEFAGRYSGSRIKDVVAMLEIYAQWIEKEFRPL